MPEACNLICHSDMYREGVFYISSNDKKFARISKSNEGWVVWYYTLKYKILRKTLGEALVAVESRFIKGKNALFTGFAKSCNC